MRISSPADNENPVRYIVQELGRTSRPWRALATLVADHPQWFHTHAWWENPQTWWPASTLLARKISSRPQHISRKILTIPPNLQSSTRKALPLFGVDLVLDGQPLTATAGDLIRMPAGIMHGIFNKSGAPVRALFWVSPAKGLYTLFSRIHNVADPAEVVRIAAEYEVEFLPPPG